MKLADIKKLKVPELKSRLQELGLESKGLKAELVGRLWSALEAGGVLQSDTAQKDPTTTIYVSSKTEEVVSLVQSQKEYSDTATQTDYEPGGLETGQRPGSEQGEEVKKQQADEDHSHEDGRGLSVEGLGRGRAFYEFKEEVKYKRAKLPQIPVTEEHLEKDPNIVTIDPHNSHLHFEIESDGASGHPRFWAQFPLLWSGCKLSHGVQQNRVGFEVRLERKLLALQSQEDVDVDYGLRVGWSVDNASLVLGEDHLSFAYDGHGKKVCLGKEADYGEVLSVGDIIGCYASFSTDGAVDLSFHKNGLFLGIAFSLDASVLHGQPLFPHVLCKSCSVRFLLDPTSPPWYPLPPGFTPLTALTEGLKSHAFPVPRSIMQCEVLMMVGLPGSGKTHWAKNHMNQHPEKHYRLLGIDEVLGCMITSGQRDNKLKQASQCLTEVIKLAAKSPDNYILDQCNTLFSARQYKLQLFTGFRRKVIIIFPSKEEWHRRLSEHQTREGEQIPPSALLKQQASCTLPEQDNFLEELQYVELPEQQAQTILQEYKDETRRLLPPVPKHDKKPHRCRKRPHPHHPPSSHKTQCTGLNGWSHLQSWSQQPKYWPTTYLQGYYYDTQNTCNYEGYW